MDNRCFDDFGVKFMNCKDLITIQILNFEHHQNHLNFLFYAFQFLFNYLVFKLEKKEHR